MDKEKKKYDVYLIAKGIGLEYEEECFMGSTYAVSEAKAVSNVRYRYRDKDAPNGVKTTQLVGSDICGTVVTWEAREHDGIEKEVGSGITVQWI